MPETKWVSLGFISPRNKWSYGTLLTTCFKGPTSGRRCNNDVCKKFVSATSLSLLLQLACTHSVCLVKWLFGLHSAPFLRERLPGFLPAHPRSYSVQHRHGSVPSQSLPLVYFFNRPQHINLNLARESRVRENVFYTRWAPTIYKWSYNPYKMAL